MPAYLLKQSQTCVTRYVILLFRAYLLDVKHLFRVLGASRWPRIKVVSSSGMNWSRHKEGHTAARRKNRQTQATQVLILALQEQWE